jgi:uncharacterized membrane protein (UPF0127 family)
MNSSAGPFALLVHIAAFCFLFAGLGAACTAQGNRAASGGKPQSGLERRELVISLASGGKARIQAELAQTGEQRAAGLMYRKDLADGQGMIFVFDNDEVQSFWMKDTLIPLSIAFILYDGTILEIKNMHPGDLSSVHSSRSVRYALEAPQGWFARAGVKPGDRLELTGL